MEQWQYCFEDVIVIRASLQNGAVSRPVLARDRKWNHFSYVLHGKKPFLSQIEQIFGRFGRCPKGFIRE